MTPVRVAIDIEGIRPAQVRIAINIHDGDYNFFPASGFFNASQGVVIRLCTIYIRIAGIVRISSNNSSALSVVKCLGYGVDIIGIAGMRNFDFDEIS